MKNEEIEKPNFIDALLGLVLEPEDTTEALFVDQKPKYGFTILLCLFLTIFVPIVSQIYKYGYTVYDSNAIISLFIVFFFTFLFFVFFEGAFLRLAQVDFQVHQLFSSSAYCLSPVLLAIWIIYGFNYFMTGGLSILTFIIKGDSSIEDQFFQIVPIAFLIAFINVFVIFFYSIRAIGKLSNVSALAMALISLIPFATSLMLALCVGDYAKPGTIGIFFHALFSPLRIFGA